MEKPAINLDRYYKSLPPPSKAKLLREMVSEILDGIREITSRLYDNDIGEALTADETKDILDKLDEADSFYSKAKDSLSVSDHWNFDNVRMDVFFAAEEYEEARKLIKEKGNDNNIINTFLDEFVLCTEKDVTRLGFLIERKEDLPKLNHKKPNVLQGLQDLDIGIESTRNAITNLSKVNDIISLEDAEDLKASLDAIQTFSEGINPYQEIDEEALTDTFTAFSDFEGKLEAISKKIAAAETDPEYAKSYALGEMEEKFVGYINDALDTISAAHFDENNDKGQEPGNSWER